MKASEAPTILSPTWNSYRRQVIDTITDVEVVMQQLGKGINAAIMTVEVAERMNIDLDTSNGYEALLALVQATRSIAQEGLRQTQVEHGGQYSLLLL